MKTILCVIPSPAPTHQAPETPVTPWCVGAGDGDTHRRVVSPLDTSYTTELRSLGLGAYQMLHRPGIIRHWHLVCLAHLTLTHHAVQALDATARKPKRQIPLPTLRDRLDALRRELRDDDIRSFTHRIRSPKTRRKVQEFLAKAG